MRDRYEPPSDAARWSPLPQDPAAGDPYSDHPPGFDEPPDASRSAGLRRLSRLTWRATQLGALATVGFATLFARTAPAQTVASQPHATPSASSSRSPSPSPSASTAHRRRRHHHHHHRASPSSAAPAPTLAPPTTAPAPPPPSPAPSPVQTTSSPSHHGGG